MTREHAIKSHDWDGIIELAKLPKIDSEKLLKQAFREAISCNDFVNADRFIPRDPNSHDFNVVLANLFEKAVNTNDIPLCQYLCDKAKSITLKDFVLEKPLYWANTFKKTEIAGMLSALQTSQQDQRTSPNRAGMFGQPAVENAHGKSATDLMRPKKPGPSTTDQ